jgi:uncharacterized protein YkwD
LKSCLCSAWCAALLGACASKTEHADHAPVVIQSTVKITLHPARPRAAVETPLAADSNPTAVMLAWLNAQREEVGLAPMTFDADVAAAAAAHARYLQLNDAHGHDEVTGAAGFTGIDVTSRVRRLTPAYGAGEVLSIVGTRDNSSEGAVQQIFASPYHRGAILFDWARAGAAAENRDASGQDARHAVTVVDFADIANPLPDTHLIAYPHDGQRDVPLSWTDVEQPDPMGPGSGYFGQEIGFPITLSGGPSAHIVLRSLELRDARGRRIACKIAALTPADAGRNTAICTPYRPLEAGVRYTAHARGELTQTTFANEPFDLQWSFTTLDAARRRA